MGALEDEGYITQPHTSAGRVPTDKGYRLFVDKLSTVKPLTVAERRAIEEFLGGAVDLDDVVNRSVRLSRSSPARSRSCSSRHCPAHRCGTSSSCGCPRPG